VRQTIDMPELVVEIHVPLTRDPSIPEGEYAFPWIDDITDRLSELEEDGVASTYDDGEEFGENYVFFITDADEAALLAAAGGIATMPGVPLGVYAMVTDSDAEEFGLGRRVDIT